jgi:hypothetical protein
MTIQVTYDVFSSKFMIQKAMRELESHEILSFDTETKGVYPKAEREEAREALKDPELPNEYRRLALMVANNSGLSYPSLVSVTHFIFGTSEDHSCIFICDDPNLEVFIWSWIKKFPHLMAIHNTLYDLKLMHHRLQSLPGNYEDTALMAKCLINHVDTWKAKVGLKEIMGDYYDPKWTLFDSYEPENLRDPDFLMYGAIDGAATFKLYQMLLEMMYA